MTLGRARHARALYCCGARTVCMVAVMVAVGLYLRRAPTAAGCAHRASAGVRERRFGFA